MQQGFKTNMTMFGWNFSCEVQRLENGLLRIIIEEGVSELQVRFSTNGLKGGDAGHGGEVSFSVDMPLGDFYQIDFKTDCSWQRHTNITAKGDFEMQILTGALLCLGALIQTSDVFSK